MARGLAGRLGGDALEDVSGSLVALAVFVVETLPQVPAESAQFASESHLHTFRVSFTVLVLDWNACTPKGGSKR